MTPAFSRTLSAPTPDATAAIAARLGTMLGAGDTILLSGPVGAGKSHFARALIQSRLAALGRTEDVPSPTFTLVQTYDLDGVEVWHADLYRLHSPRECDELGLDAAFETAICLIEWPDRLGALPPANALHLTLAQGDTPDARVMHFTADDPRWPDRLAALGQPE
jgi:tRNA threonylcarbamoyladenosine biosynthesis protein TsaE